MNDYRISNHEPDRIGDDLATIAAESPDEAAHAWVYRNYGPRAFAHRVTGDTGKSGIFRPFKPTREPNGATSCGADFHVI